MKIIYRISSDNKTKVKPNYINNVQCLDNFLKNFLGYHKKYQPHFLRGFTLFIDGKLNEDEEEDIKDLLHDHSNIIYINEGSSGKSFVKVFQYVLDNFTDDNEIIYFVENDYLHIGGSHYVLNNAFELGADFVTLYDHPDKYIPAVKGGNPYIDTDGGEVTKVYLGTNCHYKITNSTTMTFAAKLKTLKKCKDIILKWSNAIYPDDFKMFLELRENNYSLLSPIPSFATHGETAWLAPLVNWKLYS